MIELFLGALDLSPYYRFVIDRDGVFELHLRDVPDELFRDIRLYTVQRIGIALVCYDLRHHQNPVRLWRVRITTLNSYLIGKPMFDRSRYMEFPTHVIEGAFADAIPF